MIKIIGLMVGAYIYTRMMGLMMAKDTFIIIRIFAAITILFTMGCCLLLVLS